MMWFKDVRTPARRRLKNVAVAAALVAGLSGAAAAPAQAAPRPPQPTAADRPLPLGVTDFLNRPDVFLWLSPATRYIVVLGARQNADGTPPQILQQRMDVTARLANSHPFNRVIVSGGETWWLPVSEAQFMNLGLITRRVPIWQMVNEGKSTSTVQNAENTVAMLKAMGATGAVIVTNNFHMQRAMKNFRDAAAKKQANLQFVPAYAG